MYILEWLSSCSTSRIRSSGLVLGLDWTAYRFSSLCIFFVCLGPPSIFTIHVSHVHPPLPTGQLNTSTQVNNIALLHHIYGYTVTHIYITFVLLFIPFFILLPHPWAGRLTRSLLSGTIISCEMFLSNKSSFGGIFPPKVRASLDFLVCTAFRTIWRLKYITFYCKLCLHCPKSSLESIYA